MSRRTLLLGATGLLLLIVSFLPWPAGSAPAPAAATPDPVAQGSALFRAKGCVSCHRHAAVSPDTGGIGPDLTHYQADPAFLRRWLQNPRGVRPQTLMPDLGLAPAEIEALIAFLGQSPSGSLDGEGTSTGSDAGLVVPVRAASEGPAVATCPLTPPVAQPPDDTDVFGDGSAADWFCSKDNQLCAIKSGPWSAGSQKVGWRKPAASTVTISGRRLDGDAPPLGATVPDGYRSTFQATGLIFPSEGCWQVEAQAGESRLRFVVEVAAGSAVASDPACVDLEDVVAASDGIIVGRVTESVPGPDGRYVWHDVGVSGIWKNPYGSGAFTGINLLQDLSVEPALQERHSYLLFFHNDPFRLVCPAQTLGEVANGQLLRVGDETVAGWPEEGETAEMLQTRIQGILGGAPSQ